MATKTKAFDAATYLEAEEDVAAYMTEALASGDAAIVAHALGAVARARGMSRIARETGLSRESLYRALSADGNPELATVLRIIDAIGLRLTAEPATKAA
ncbi:MAG TPA: addiction module antidote protein [Stellaceae bacterium]|nr:addiction module antidote protein [Stellaceae bacterium]